MKKYICENDYCKKYRFDDSKIHSPECPYCGCKFITVEEVFTTPPSSKRKHKKR